VDLESISIQVFISVPGIISTTMQTSCKKRMILNKPHKMVKLKINQQNQIEHGENPNKCSEQDPIRLIDGKK